MRLKGSLAVISTTALLYGGAMFSQEVQAQGPSEDVGSGIEAKDTTSLESRVNAGRAGTIIIDPGHDEIYTGSQSGRVDEGKLNLDLSRYLNESLKNEGFRVSLTRDSTVGVNVSRQDFDDNDSITYKDEILARADYIKRMNPDCALIIHYNANKYTSRLRGMEIFFYGITSEAQSNDKVLNRNQPSKCTEYSAKMRSLAENLGYYLKAHGIKVTVMGSDMMLLKENPDNTLYLEMGYLTNPKDLKTTTTPEWQMDMARMITDFMTENKDDIRMPDATYTADNFIVGMDYIRDIKIPKISSPLTRELGYIKPPNNDTFQKKRFWKRKAHT